MRDAPRSRPVARSSAETTPNSTRTTLRRSSRVANGSATKALNVCRSRFASTVRHSVVFPVPMSPLSTLRLSRRRIPDRRSLNAAPCELLL